jgi:response regulator RpfG family c-di-GMP phosphodiesterase
MKPKGMLLFVDDNRQEFEMFREVFRTFSDNELLYAENGEEGLKLIHEYKYSLFMIISDINMPKMNGLEMKRIVEGTPILKIRSIPFVFRTVHNNVVVIKEAYSLGIQGLFIKTEDPEELRGQIDLILKFWTKAVHPNTLD